MASSPPYTRNPGPDKNIDEREIDRFNRHAEAWWDPDGAFKVVHAFNNVRLAKIEKKIAHNFSRNLSSCQPFSGLSCLDIGCGGGLISEPLAKHGAQVTGIDASQKNIEIARLHARDSNVDVDYQQGMIDDISATHNNFDVILNLEVLEHVPDPDRLLSSCIKLLKPNGLLIVSTLNRTLRSFVLAIIGAEYVLRWLPKGTHAWSKFIRPEKIKTTLSQNLLTTSEICGVSFNPFRNKWTVTADTSVNYMIFARKREIDSGNAN